MRLPVLHGVIKRRLLVNYRVDPAVIQRLLPKPFRPKLHAGHAVAGICLIRLENIRPSFVPSLFGIASENAAHRIAVEWSEPAGLREGVFIPRRDTGSRLNHLAGGRLFPGEHHLASFRVSEIGGSVALEMASTDGSASLRVKGDIAAELPSTSCFASLAEASGFFEPGSLGYSVTSRPGQLHGVSLHTKQWLVEPFHVQHVYSSFFANDVSFPPGSAVFDHALIMRNIQHEWHGTPDLYLEPRAS